MSAKTPERLADEAYAVLADIYVTGTRPLAESQVAHAHEWLRDYELYNKKRHVDQRRMNEVTVRCLGSLPAFAPFSGPMAHLLLSRDNRHVNLAVGPEKAKLNVEHLIGYLRYIARDRFLADTMEVSHPSTRNIVRDLASYAQDIHNKLTELGLEEEN